MHGKSKTYGQYYVVEQPQEQEIVDWLAKEKDQEKQGSPKGN
jgi:hypothetical protein